MVTKPKRTRVYHRDAKFRSEWVGILTHYPATGLYRVTFYSRTPTFLGLTPNRQRYIQSRKHYDAECLRYAEHCGYAAFQRTP